MIQTALFFILGFLSAGFLALLVAPAIWRRAVTLTRRRVEGSLPLTMGEIQADKDRLRAEYALSVRQLEMQVKSLKEKVALQMVQAGRDREEITRLGEVRIDKDGELAKAHAEIAEQRAALAKDTEAQAALSAEIATLKEKAEKQQAEIAKLARMYDEASFSASSRQIELVSMESKIDRQKDEFSVLRDERKDAQRQAREAEVESKSLTTALRDEHKKVVVLENRMAQMTSKLADAEEKLERREAELARLRGGAPKASDKADALTRLEERLTKLTRENKKLRASLEGAAEAATVAQPAGDEATAELRRQIGELAAEMVNLTAKLEGPDSPIHKALNSGANGNAGNGEPSLADRIRALRESA